MAEDVKKKLKRFGLSGLNKPKRSASGKNSQHVAVRDGGKLKVNTYGEEGDRTDGNAKAGSEPRRERQRTT